MSARRRPPGESETKLAELYQEFSARVHESRSVEDNRILACFPALGQAVRIGAEMQELAYENQLSAFWLEYGAEVFDTYGDLIRRVSIYRESLRRMLLDTTVLQLIGLPDGQERRRALAQMVMVGSPQDICVSCTCQANRFGHDAFGRGRVLELMSEILRLHLDARGVYQALVVLLTEDRDRRTEVSRYITPVILGRTDWTTTERVHLRRLCEDAGIDMR